MWKDDWATCSLHTLMDISFFFKCYFLISHVEVLWKLFFSLKKKKKTDLVVKWNNSSPFNSSGNCWNRWPNLRRLILKPLTRWVYMCSTLCRSLHTWLCGSKCTMHGHSWRKNKSSLLCETQISDGFGHSRIRFLGKLDSYWADFCCVV